MGRLERGAASPLTAEISPNLPLEGASD